MGTPGEADGQPQGIPTSMPLGGCAKGSRILTLVPQQLIGEKINIYNPEKKCTQVGTIKNFDSIKKEHSIQMDPDTTVMLNLLECYWCQSVEDSKSVEPEEPEKEIATLPSPIMEEILTTAEEEGKGKRKRRPSTRQDQAMADKLGSIQAKGRRPYKPGGCRIGKLYTNEDLVGSRVLMWSQRDSVYYAGGVKDFNSQTRLHTILYLDGTEESLNMKDAIWRIANSEFDDVYPNDFTIKAREEGKIDKRKRRRAHIDVQSGFPTSAVETLLTLASSGSGPSSGPNLLMESAAAAAADQKFPVTASPGRSRIIGGLHRGHHTSDEGHRRMLPASTPVKDAHLLRGERREAAGDGSRAGDGDQPASTQGRNGSQKLVASSLEFQVHKVDTPDSGYHVLCSVPSGTRISDVHVTCGNACIIIEHGRNTSNEPSHPEENSAGSGCSRLVILLPEPIRPSSASAKLTQGGKLAVFTSLAA